MPRGRRPEATYRENNNTVPFDEDIHFDALCPERWLPNAALQVRAQQLLDQYRAKLPHMNLVGESGENRSMRDGTIAPSRNDSDRTHVPAHQVPEAEMQLIARNFDEFDDTFPGDLMDCPRA